ncbi:MAG TPA: PilZ domain-containing protein [Candidatus Acidoferrales bacterium]|nr:PilZ domain-containing protein [Candidatus Acidoferrales bacterium]
MAETGQRRSERVLVDVPIAVRGQSADRRSFREETFTVTVSAHGALVMLATRVALGQRLVLMNPQNSDERECRVAYIGPSHAGLSQVAIEFNRPAPEFWPIASPPQGWTNSRKNFS